MRAMHGNGFFEMAWKCFYVDKQTSVFGPLEAETSPRATKGAYVFGGFHFVFMVALLYCSVLF
jgi:hypothetical protein